MDCTDISAKIPTEKLISSSPFDEEMVVATRKKVEFKLKFNGSKL